MIDGLLQNHLGEVLAVVAGGGGGGNTGGGAAPRRHGVQQGPWGFYSLGVCVCVCVLLGKYGQAVGRGWGSAGVDWVAHSTVGRLIGESKPCLRNGASRRGGSAPAAVDVQVAELARHDAELVLVVGGEHGGQELDVRVLPAQLPEKVQVGHLDAIPAGAQRCVGPAHRPHLECHRQTVLCRNTQQHVLEHLGRAGFRPGACIRTRHRPFAHQLRLSVRPPARRARGRVRESSRRRCHEVDRLHHPDPIAQVAHAAVDRRGVRRSIRRLGADQRGSDSVPLARQDRVDAQRGAQAWRARPRRRSRAGRRPVLRLLRREGGEDVLHICGGILLGEPGAQRCQAVAGCGAVGSGCGQQEIAESEQIQRSDDPAASFGEGCALDEELFEDQVGLLALWPAEELVCRRRPAAGFHMHRVQY
eukprot:scaffold7704_cov112-Isochrysis_galbana.AAC.11